ncbi:hypothetical protein S245_043136, partial [Arachis hypogaea]
SFLKPYHLTVTHATSFLSIVGVSVTIVFCGTISIVVHGTVSIDFSIVVFGSGSDAATSFLSVVGISNFVFSIFFMNFCFI